MGSPKKVKPLTSRDIFEELKKDIEAEKINKEEAEKRQEDINKRFDEIQKKLEETKALNKELESPLNLEDSKALEDAIDKELSEAAEEVKSGKKSKSKVKEKRL